MISDQPEPSAEPKRAAIVITDATFDSVRAYDNGTRVKCVVLMDITELTETQRKKFLERSLAALTRMGKKVMSEKA